MAIGVYIPVRNVCNNLMNMFQMYPPPVTVLNAQMSESVKLPQQLHTNVDVRQVSVVIALEIVRNNLHHVSMDHDVWFQKLE